MPKPTIYAIAGCNGAGKTTFAKEFLPSIGVIRFLNADEIARGLDWNMKLSVDLARDEEVASDRRSCWLRAERGKRDRCSNRVLDHLDDRNTYSVMNLKFSTLFIGVSTLLFVQTEPLAGQQIPASELPPPGTDTGLDGKYDPENPFARLIRGENGVARIFEDEHVLVFMPRGEVVAPGHVLVIPKRLGARNLLDLKPDELRDLLIAVQKAAMAQKKGLGATGFKVIQNNGLSSSQTVYHAHFHVVPSFGGKAPGPPAPRRELPDPEYNEIAAKLRVAWPK